MEEPEAGPDGGVLSFDTGRARAISRELRTPELESLRPNTTAHLLESLADEVDRLRKEHQSDLAHIDEWVRKHEKLLIEIQEHECEYQQGQTSRDFPGGGPA